MEIYALETGIRHFHIHRLRHTFAKIVSEYSKSMAETQEALGHSNIKTTQIYVQRLAVKKDKHSKSIRDALKKYVGFRFLFTKSPKFRNGMTRLLTKKGLLGDL